MMNDPLPPLAEAYAPDADRVGTDAPSRKPEWLVHLLALLIHFLLEQMLLAAGRGSRLPSWWFARPDLPPGSAQQLAASIRGEFGNAIAWMCLRRGIGPGHPDWPELSRAIVTFGGSVQGFRRGLPAIGLQWWENPNIIPGMIGMPEATPATDAIAFLLSRQEIAGPTSAPVHIVASETAPAPPFAFPLQVRARTATGPPIGPPGNCACQYACA